MSLKKQKKYKEAFLQCDLPRKKFPDNADIKFLQSEIGMMVKRCAHENCPVPVASQAELFKCSACKDTFYCSRDCQKSDWCRHRYTCNAGPEFVRCSQCCKMFDCKKRLRCDICKGMWYCSIKCKEEDKERHERVSCAPYFKEKELFDKWFESDAANEALAELATHAMSKEEFLSKDDLEFFIVINLRFSWKYCSFVPIEPPRTIYKADMNPTQIEDMRRQKSFKKSLGPLNLGHILAVRFLPNNGQDRVLHGRYRPQIYGPCQYRLYPFEAAMTSTFNQVNCADNPILPSSWLQIQNNYSNDLTKWAADAQKSGILDDFVLASYHDQSKTSYSSTKEYTVSISFEFGERLGEIKRLLSHRITKISDIKDSSLANKIRKSMEESLCDENHVQFSLAMYCNNFGSEVLTVLPVNISIEQIKAYTKSSYTDEVMEKLWQDLLKVPFPKCKPTPEYPDI